MTNDISNLQVAPAQINVQIGDLRGNTDKIAKRIDEAKHRGADLAVFPESAILGYPPRDLLTRTELINRQLDRLEDIAAMTDDEFGVVVGYIDINDSDTGKPLHNAAALCHRGEIRGTTNKQLLPTYDVFEEARYFEPGGDAPGVFDFKGHSIGISICEDAWADQTQQGRKVYDSDPIAGLVDAGADFIVNIAASPFYIEKDQVRRELVRSHTTRHDTWIIYVNHVGGQDELVFDGRSFVAAPDGSIVRELPSFEEAVETVQLDHHTPSYSTPTGGETHSISNVREAISIGIADYFRKTGFKGAIIGISGGIDSAVTAAVAVDALGSDNVVGLAMPSPYTSQQSMEDARAVAENLEIELRELSICSHFESYKTQLQEALPEGDHELAWENVQARIRGDLLMAFSNDTDRLVLATGNKSELAVGYCTLYGDMCGALTPLGDCPKQLVYQLAEHFNSVGQGPVIPESVISKAPSAELRPDQRDRDDLPPYAEVDAILAGYIEQGLSADALVDQGHDPETVDDVVRRIQTNEFKRRQAAPVIKVTEKSFGMGWRYPLSASYHQLLVDQ